MKFTTGLLLAALAGALTGAAFHSNAAETWTAAKVEGEYTCDGIHYNPKGEKGGVSHKGFALTVNAGVVQFGPVGGSKTMLTRKDFRTAGLYGDDGETMKVMISSPSHYVAFDYTDLTSGERAVFHNCTKTSKLGF